jgi:hypothetical protein
LQKVAGEKVEESLSFIKKLLILSLIFKMVLEIGSVISKSLERLVINSVRLPLYWSKPTIQCPCPYQAYK